jgi:hypothetical protein
MMNLLLGPDSSNCIPFSGFSFQPLVTEGVIRGNVESTVRMTPKPMAPFAIQASLHMGKNAYPARASGATAVWLGTQTERRHSVSFSGALQDDATEQQIHGSFSDTAGELSKDHDGELEPDSNSTTTGHGEAILRVVPRINGNNHICKVCQKALSSRMQLKQHIIREHVKVNEDKPFVCPSCQLSFKRIAHLHRHQTVHTGSRTFECSKCSKTFARNDHLTAHLWTHETGPFICGSCHGEFSSRANLKLHTSTEHPLRRKRRRVANITTPMDLII